MDITPAPPFINHTQAFATCVELHRAINGFVWAVTSDDVEHDIDDLTMAAVRTTAMTDTMVYAPWRFWESEQHERTDSAIDAFCEHLLFEDVIAVFGFDRSSDVRAITMWRPPAEWMTGSGHEGKRGILFGAWVTINGEVVPSPAFMLVENDLLFEANAGYADESAQRESVEMVMKLAYHLVGPHELVDLEGVSRQVMRNAEKNGATPNVLVRNPV